VMRVDIGGHDGSEGCSDVHGSNGDLHDRERMGRHAASTTSPLGGALLNNES
jgi:hypothetical protein